MQEKLLELEKRLAIVEGKITQGEQIIMNHTKTIDYLITFLKTVFKKEIEGNVGKRIIH